MKQILTFFACFVVSVAAMSQNEVRKMKVATDDGVRTYVVEKVNEITFVTESDEPTMYEGHEYVDLGLPSGKLWATCNVGANAPYEYGDYFQWGETEPHNYETEPYDWDNYKYGKYFNEIEKYCQLALYAKDGKTDALKELVPDDYAAAANWGGTWSMPTISDWEELQENCAWKWTNEGGKDGYKLTSVINGAVLFLPAAGYRELSDLEKDGFYGCYWSSSLYENAPCKAWCLDFTSTDHYSNSCNRYFGQSVRLVCVLPEE